MPTNSQLVAVALVAIAVALWIAVVWGFDISA